MRTFPKTFILIAAILLFPSICLSQTTKMITLKDGSAIKGQVVDFKNNIYTIKTDTLGFVNIKDADIISIAQPQAHKPQLQNPSALGMQNSQNSLSGLGQMSPQINQMIQSVLMDPALMAEMMKMMEDPQMRGLFEDKRSMDAILRMDHKEIEGNANVQNLINNPKMQELMKKLSEKFDIQQPQQ